MATFTDNAGRQWTPAIDIDALRRVREGLALNLMDVLKPGGAAALEDPVRLVDTLYLILKPATDAAGVTDEDFGRSLCGQPIDDAAGALLEALADFLPPARGALVRKAIAGVRGLDREIVRQVGDRLDEAVAAVAESIREAHANGPLAEAAAMGGRAQDAIAAARAHLAATPADGRPSAE